MKKLIAISITLALVASAAFAQVTVSGVARTMWKPFFIAQESADVTNSLGWYGHIQLDAKTEGDIFGGSVRATPTAFGAGDTLKESSTTGGVAYDWAYVWWQPIQQVKFTLGANSDGWYTVDNVAGWDFHTDANHFVAVGNKYYTAGDAAFTSGWSHGASFVITPLDGLQLVFGLPVDTDTTNAMETWKHFLLQAQYSLDNLGIITLTYNSGKQDITKQPGGFDGTDGSFDTGKVDASTIYASFQLKMIENLALHFGVSYSFPAKSSTGYKDATAYSPIALGLGADYKAGDFGVKGRLGFSFLGSYDSGASSDNKYPTPFEFDLEVMPYYDLGILKAYLSLGMQLTTDTEDNKGTNIADSHVNFFVNPYVIKSVGNGSFFAGFALEGYAVPDTYTSGSMPYKEKFKWSIPVGLQFTF